MKQVLLLLLALTGVEGFSFYYFGYIYSSLPSITLKPDNAYYCFGKAYDGSPNPNCISLKAPSARDNKFTPLTSQEEAKYLPMAFPKASGLDSSSRGYFSSNGQTVSLYFLTVGKMTRVVLDTPAKVDYKIEAGTLGTVESGSVSGQKVLKLSACILQSGGLLLLGKTKDHGPCYKSTCEEPTSSPWKPIVKEEKCDKKDSCVKGTCVARATCTFTGPSAIDASGASKVINDRCTYSLMSSTKLPGFSIKGVYKDRRRPNLGFLESVEITYSSVKYVLAQGGKFLKNGAEEALTATPKDVDGLQVSKTDRGLLVSYTKTGLTAEVFFDGYTAQIIMKGPAKSDFGLGGACASVSNLVSTLPNGCKVIHTDTSKAIDCKPVKERCALLTKQPFTTCSISATPYAKVCEDTLCKYPSVDNLPCQFFEAYARACEVSLEEKVENWRSNSKCPTSPKSLCPGTSCGSKEFCGQKEHTLEWACLCRPRGVQKYRDDKTLGDSTICDKNTASVSLVNCLLEEKGIDYKKLHLNDPTCGPVYSDGMATFTFTSSKQCGAEVENKEKEVIFSNTIQTGDAKGVIVRQNILSIDFSCIHAQPKVNTMKFSVTSSQVTSSVTSGSWDYKLTMKAYLDQALSKPATTVNINQKVFVELTTTGLDSSLVVIVIDSCWATKENDPNKDPKYYLIFKSCPNPKDQTVKITGNGKGTSSSFSFNTFQFPGGKSDIFLHCKVKLCGLKKGETCVPVCGKGRKRRSASFMDEDPSPALITMAWTS